LWGALGVPPAQMQMLLEEGMLCCLQVLFNIYIFFFLLCVCLPFPIRFI
jgi:hypothetical protein